jgi:chemotaxis protein methyltransferase CheR
MYFTPEWVNKISESIFNSLTEDGWFVVSSSELSSQVFPLFTTVNFQGAVLYNKGKHGAAHKLPDYVPIEEKFQPIVNSPIHSISSSPSHPVSTSPHLTSPSAAPVKEKPLPTHVESTATKIFAIRLLANQGYLSEALTLCNEAIESEKLVPGFYFLRASILQEMDRSSEAIASLKKAIYIDPDYIMGHFTLGNLFNHQGNTRNANRHFKNVLDLLDKCTNDEILPESEGLSVKYIREIILANMKTIRTK